MNWNNDFYNIEIKVDGKFDVDKTYDELGLSLKRDKNGIPQYQYKLDNLFRGIEGICFLHNCLVVKTMNLGTDVEHLNEIKEKLNCLNVNVALFSPYVKGKHNGLTYNIYFRPNCCEVKYPLEEK